MKNTEEWRAASRFGRDDVRTTCLGGQPEDANDPEGAAGAIELTLPECFSEKAWALWEYLDDTAFLYEYKGRLVMTDESLELTAHGDGSRRAPLGGPRFVCESWEELEAALEAAYDDLREEDLL